MTRKFWRVLVLVAGAVFLLGCGDATGPKLCEQNPQTYTITDSTTTITVTVYRCAG